jgi:hypothetical protein
VVATAGNAVEVVVELVTVREMGLPGRVLAFAEVGIL